MSDYDNFAALLASCRDEEVSFGILMLSMVESRLTSDHFIPGAFDRFESVDGIADIATEDFRALMLTLCLNQTRALPQ